MQIKQRRIKNMHQLLVIFVSTLSTCAYAAAPKFNFELETGTEYDSNLAVVELDQYSAASDWALLANMRAYGEWKPNEQSTLKGGLSYNTKSWQELSSYDLAIPQYFVDANHTFSFATLGSSYHHADAQLDGTDFLTLKQSSLYMSRLFKKRFYLRGAVNYQDKDFTTSAERNAHTLLFAGDMFVFFNNAKTFFALGFNLEDEQARVNYFGYEGLNIRSSINQRFSLWSKNNKVQLGVIYEDRDYAATNPELDAVRRDTRKIMNLGWQIETTKWLTLMSSVERGNYQSNYAAADYTESRASITLKANF